MNRLASYTEEEDEKISSWFGILDKVNSAILVMIEVSNHSDAYTLFESLNNRGTPLTAVDLIKNLLLARLDINGDGDIDYYFTRWTDILNNLGDEYSNQERFFRQNYNAFRKSLNEPFDKGDKQYPLGPIATRSTMLDIYEKIITKDPVTALNELTKNSEIYSKIILIQTDDVPGDLLGAFFDLRSVQGAPSYLFIMYLLKNKKQLQVSDEEVVQICRMLVNFFIRRNMTDTPPTRDLTRMFMSFIEAVEQNGYMGTEVYEKLRETLISVAASDEVFEEKLRGPVYDDNSGATRFILCMLAQKGMTKENAVDLWKKTNSNQFVWTIEHIFPQGANIPKEWVDMIADGDYEKAKEYQSLYVHTFGNLTITGYNSTLSNKSFEEKKERRDSNGNYIGYKNTLNLNDDVRDKDEWTVDVIKARTDRIVREIMEMFKL